jgi:succinate dehydrogenase / fumarate reductase cytochrome b subunit
MSKRARPLSPHAGIYRWQYTNTLSILNRATGVYLSVGLLLFVYWLLAVASGPDGYETAQVVFVHPLTRLALVAWTAAFFYHLLNGIRHLSWDFGYGFERKVARLTGWGVVIATVLLTGLCWFLIATRLNGNDGGSI